MVSELQLRKELEDLVRDMRDAQRKYFKERTHEALAESKHLEKLVDLKLHEIKESESPSLF